MIKTICWNTRSINTQGSLERLQALKKIHHLSMIAILEPFVDNSHINIVRIQLQIDHAVSNPNGKIWLFCLMKSLAIFRKMRAAQARVWKRLDRMVNDKWLEAMPQTTIEHLPSVGSDHSPLLMEMTVREESPIKYFKFLHCWVDMRIFWKLCQPIGIGRCMDFEEKIKKAEEDLVDNNTEDMRQQLHHMNANYIKHLKLEESILKQRTQLEWFKEGDANNKYFHALMRGCPLYIGRQRIIYYSYLVGKVTKKISGWHSRFLSFGGKITLVKHVLQDIPIHTMATVSPPNTTIKYIESFIANFFWGRDNDKRKYHWASLETMSLPCEEGGVGLKRLTDICTALQFKQWWVFRSKSSLWGNFLKAKYCHQRENPVAKKLHTGQSLV
ncbi:hypothetical protein H5410_060211 [Solanum commersonii]|uniref:Uncharacterized protein n=1 Tax=Solanum commersonii TaxID=4109 RepID=A0A9J5W4G4_SOLCO|nr:hypothetical protein H5410_060211 [Solanum commersonii]